MLKRAVQVFTISICLLATLFCSACGALKAVTESEQKLAELEQQEAELEQKKAELEQELAEMETSTVLETITELNQPYEGSVFRITATDIRSVQNSYIHTEHDKIVIAVQFVVENISNSESDFGAAYINAYVDDVSTTPTSSPDLENNLSLRQTIAPGKRAEGYYCVEALADTKIIELHVPADDSFKKNYVVFSFEVPSVEEIDS